MQPVISPFDAVLLGIVEGLTEFLPVSSTGHLILTSYWLGLAGPDGRLYPGVDAFNIVIQAGALLAVIGIYQRRVRAMIQGVFGRDPAGLRLALQLLVAFTPAVVLGLLGGSAIKERLFNPTTVAAALAVGGAAMIAVEVGRSRRGLGPGVGRELEAMTLRLALIIGLAQCLALWPGTSRSMVTIVAALLLGFTPRAAAEFSFLLALPTLGAATVYDSLKEGGAILEAGGRLGLAIGFVVSCVVAWLAVKTFLAYLTRHGMMVFGYYRIVLAAVVVVAFVLA